MENLETLNKQLKEKLNQLDEYVSDTRNDIFSEEAEKLRKEIYELQDKINLLKSARTISEQKTIGSEEDREIDILQQDIQQLINRCMILNKDEMSATARVMFGREIVLSFRKLLQENKLLKAENTQQVEIIKNSVSKDKIIEKMQEVETKRNLEELQLFPFSNVPMLLPDDKEYDYKMQVLYEVLKGR